MPRFYLDLRRALAAHEKNDTPWTPAASLIIGVDAALEMIRTEGIEQVWRRHRRMATAVRAGVEALGLKLFSRDASFAVTPVWVPDGVEWKAFNAMLKKTYGITVAGGQDEYAGRIFRISHLGYYDELDMVTVIAAVERSLHDCKWTFEAGAGVRAVQRSFMESAG